MDFKPPAVIDNGTGYTKMGYAGNVEPQYIIPTTISLPSSKGTSSFVDSKRGGVEDLDFYIGTDCAKHTSTHAINYPIRHGLIENWDNMEVSRSQGRRGHKASTLCTR